MFQNGKVIAVRVKKKKDIEPLPIWVTKEPTIS